MARFFSWFKSFLFGRSQWISVNSSLSRRFNLDCGVPQESCLGPLFYSHSRPVDCFRLFERIRLTFIVLQTILNYIFPSVRMTLLMLWSPVLMILTESLKLNDDESEFLVIGTPQQLAEVNTHCIRVGDCNVSAVPSARNLGSWLDTKLSMVTHITKLPGSSFYYLNDIRRIRKYLSTRCAETLVRAFVSARIDYCNSILYSNSWLSFKQA